MAKKFISFKKQIFQIEDIKNTMSALEKISAASVHFLKLSALLMQEYAFLLYNLLTHIENEEISNKFFKKPNNKNRLNVIIGTEKGICGDLLNKLFDFFSKKYEKKDKVLIIGEKSKEYLKERNIKFDYFFSVKKDIPKKEDIKEIENFLINQFTNGKFSEILIFYSKLETISLQRPQYFRFLPIYQKAFEKEINLRNRNNKVYYILEPSKKEILNYLISDYIGLVFYQKVLEAKLSELAARTVATESAAEKANELKNLLSHMYFKERQKEITKKITDLYSHYLLLKK